MSRQSVFDALVRRLEKVNRAVDDPTTDAYQRELYISQGELIYRACRVVSSGEGLDDLIVELTEVRSDELSIFSGPNGLADLLLDDLEGLERSDVDE